MKAFHLLNETELRIKAIIKLGDATSEEAVLCLRDVALDSKEKYSAATIESLEKIGNNHAMKALEHLIIHLGYIYNVRAAEALAVIQKKEPIKILEQFGFNKDGY